MRLRETVTAVKSYKIERLKNVTKYRDEAVYGDVEHSYVCDHNFNYTTSPKYAWCYTENGTVVFEAILADILPKLFNPQLYEKIWEKLPAMKRAQCIELLETLRDAIKEIASQA